MSSFFRRACFVVDQSIDRYKLVHGIVTETPPLSVGDRDLLVAIVSGMMRAGRPTDLVYGFAHFRLGRMIENSNLSQWAIRQCLRVFNTGNLRPADAPCVPPEVEQKLVIELDARLGAGQDALEISTQLDKMIREACLYALPTQLVYTGVEFVPIN